MAEKTVPWWRKALSFAFGGIRTGFGLLARLAKAEPAGEPLIAAPTLKSPEEEGLIEEFPNLETAEAVPAAIEEPTKPAEAISAPEAVAEPVELPETDTPDKKEEPAAESGPRPFAQDQETAADGPRSPDSDPGAESPAENVASEVSLPEALTTDSALPVANSDEIAVAGIEEPVDGTAFEGAEAIPAAAAPQFEDFAAPADEGDAERASVSEAVAESESGLELVSAEELATAEEALASALLAQVTELSTESVLTEPVAEAAPKEERVADPEPESVSLPEAFSIPEFDSRSEPALPDPEKWLEKSLAGDPAAAEPVEEPAARDAWLEPIPESEPMHGSAAEPVAVPELAPAGDAGISALAGPEDCLASDAEMVELVAVQGPILTEVPGEETSGAETCADSAEVLQGFNPENSSVAEPRDVFAAAPSAPLEPEVSIATKPVASATGIAPADFIAFMPESVPSPSSPVEISLAPELEPSASFRAPTDLIGFTPGDEPPVPGLEGDSNPDALGAEPPAESATEPEMVAEVVAAVEPQPEAKAVHELVVDEDAVPAPESAAPVEPEGEAEVEPPDEIPADENVPTAESAPGDGLVSEPAAGTEQGPELKPEEVVEPVTEPEPAVAEPIAAPEPVAAEVAPVVEPVKAPDPPAPAHAKPQIVIKSRDNEADLSPFSVIVAQVYDGPLDLLLDLIRKQDIDIYDIPIAKITAQFLAYVNQLKASDMDVAGEFIYTASLLIHIKSKMLLPRTPTGPEDAAEDPRRELVERLLEHERFKNAAQMLQQKQMLEAATWTNPGQREFKDDAGPSRRSPPTR